MMPEQDDLLEVGHITGVHGIKGWIKLYSNTIPREQILTLKPWLLEVNGELIEFSVKGKVQGKLVLAHLKGCDDRNTALEYINCKIYIKSDQLPSLDDGDFYWSDLEGLKVNTLSGEELGVVDHLLETGANDVLVVEGEKQHLIPFVKDQIVRKIDLDEGIIQVDWQADY